MFYHKKPKTLKIAFRKGQPLRAMKCFVKSGLKKVTDSTLKKQTQPFPVT